MTESIARMSLILHIGSPKTATSTLQNAFFPHHPGLVFVGKEVDGDKAFTGWRSSEWTQLMLALERTNMEFAPDRAAVRRMVAQIIEEAAGQPVVMSSEDLCLFSGISPWAKLDRIQDLFGAFGPIRVVWALREQVSLIKSIYLTEHRGEMLNLSNARQSWHPDFDRYLDIHFNYGWGATLECFRYSAMIDRYQERLGQENVFVYAFESFKREPEETLRRMCRFMGVAEDVACIQETPHKRENAHYSKRAYAYSGLRAKMISGLRLSAVLPSSMVQAFRRWVNSGSSFDFEPTEAAVRRITEYYRADNADLFRRHGIRL